MLHASIQFLGRISTSPPLYDMPMSSEQPGPRVITESRGKFLEELGLFSTYLHTGYPLSLEDVME